MRKSTYIERLADGTTRVVDYDPRDGIVSNRISLAKRVRFFEKKIQYNRVNGIIDPSLFPKLKELQRRLSAFDSKNNFRGNRPDLLPTRKEARKEIPAGRLGPKRICVTPALEDFRALVVARVSGGKDQGRQPATRIPAVNGTTDCRPPDSSSDRHTGSGPSPIDTVAPGFATEPLKV